MFKTVKVIKILKSILFLTVKEMCNLEEQLFLLINTDKLTKIIKNICKKFNNLL